MNTYYNDYYEARGYCYNEMYKSLGGTRSAPSRSRATVVSAPSVQFVVEGTYQFMISRFKRTCDVVPQRGDKQIEMVWES